MMSVDTRYRAKARVRAGFTMLELAIAVALATFVVAALYRLFINQSRQLAFLDTQAEMHQNLRFATDVISRTLRIAGLGTANEVRGKLGYPSGDNDTLPALISFDSWGAGGSDAVTVVHMDPSLMMSTSYAVFPPAYTTQLYMDIVNHPEYRTMLSSFSSNEMLLCFDYARSEGMLGLLWVITGVNPSTGTINVETNDTYSDYNTVLPSTTNLTSVMTCSKAEVITFYIDNNETDGIGPGSVKHPVLMMDLDFTFPSGGPNANDVPLVDDIEDLQVSYCLSDMDQTHPCNDDTNFVPTVSSGNIVWMVRLGLVARSAREDQGRLQQGFRPALMNHTASSTDDYYYRQVMTTEVTTRNLRFFSHIR